VDADRRLGIAVRQCLAGDRCPDGGLVLLLRLVLLRLDFLTLAESLTVVARDPGKKEYRFPRHSHHVAHRGACGKTRVVPKNCRPRLRKWGL